MLRHLGHPAEAARLEDAVRDVIAAGVSTTYDLGGPAGTAAFADAIVAQLTTTTAAR
jgi:isocitrate/isopropylmalate dehydrogenase